jgi:metal-responsive CopG/Arc/MetJ family transcriptional regulator
MTIMKTIAITIDEHMLQRVDYLVTTNVPVTNRSQIIRQAVADYVNRQERQSEEDREREIFRKHRQRLARQADALVKEQAKV